MSGFIKLTGSSSYPSSTFLRVDKIVFVDTEDKTDEKTGKTTRQTVIGTMYGWRIEEFEETPEQVMKLINEANQ